MTECIICGADIDLPGDTVACEIITCPDCGSDLEVIKINPLVLAEAPQEEEDWGE
ncbi:lysine biosynthesis protein LysW [Acidobacteriota bacterium]